MIAGDAAGDVAAEEAELLRRVAAGDRGAPLEALYDRYERRLYGVGLRLLGDKGLAEELVQETFVRLWRSADRFDPDRGSVASFLFTVARRIAIDLWRRPSSRPFSPEPGSDVPGPEQVEQVIVSVTVRDGLDALSQDHRSVLTLAYQHGLSQREIAEHLGLPLGTVKTRTYHALRALKAALQERGIDA